MIIKHFINYIITRNSVDDILESYETQSEKGYVFERLYDIVIKFGFCDIFNNNYDHLIGNTNNGRLKVLKNINKYLDTNVFSGNHSGVSDITLFDNTTNTFIFQIYF